MGSLVDCKKEETILAFFSVVAISANLSTKTIDDKVNQRFLNMQGKVSGNGYRVPGSNLIPDT